MAPRSAADRQILEAFRAWRDALTAVGVDTSGYRLRSGTNTDAFTDGGRATARYKVVRERFTNVADYVEYPLGNTVFRRGELETALEYATRTLRLIPGTPDGTERETSGGLYAYPPGNDKQTGPFGTVELTDGAEVWKLEPHEARQMARELRTGTAPTSLWRHPDMSAADRAILASLLDRAADGAESSRDWKAFAAFAATA